MSTSTRSTRSTRAPRDPDPESLARSSDRVDTLRPRAYPAHNVPDEYVLLDSFPTPHAAHLAANALRAVNIEVRIANESAVSALPHLETALGGVKLYVREADYDDAARILHGDADLVEQPYREHADSLAPPDDESDDDSALAQPTGYDDMATRAFRASVVGLFLCPLVLHAYSLSLLLRLPGSKGISKQALQRARVAWVINGVVALLALLGFLRFMAG